MIGSSGSRIKPCTLQDHHIKIQSLIIDHLISKIWGNVYSDHLKYDLPQDEGDKSDPITFRQYVASITSKMGEYARDQLFHAISCENDPTTVHVMHFTHHKGKR